MTRMKRCEREEKYDVKSEDDSKVITHSHKKRRESEPKDPDTERDEYIRFRQSILLVEGSRAIYDILNRPEMSVDKVVNNDDKEKKRELISISKIINTSEDSSCMDMLIQASLVYISRLHEETLEMSESQHMDIAAACLRLAYTFYGSDDGVNRLRTKYFIHAFKTINYDITVKRLNDTQLWIFRHLDHKLWIEFPEYSSEMVDTRDIPLSITFNNLEKEILNMKDLWVIVTMYQKTTEGYIAPKERKDRLPDNIWDMNQRDIERILNRMGWKKMSECSLKHVLPGNYKMKDYITSRFRNCLWLVSNVTCADGKMMYVEKDLYDIWMTKRDMTSICEKMKSVIIYYLKRLGCMDLNIDKKYIRKRERNECKYTASQMITFDMSKTCVDTVKTVEMLLEFARVKTPLLETLKTFTTRHEKFVTKCNNTCETSHKRTS